MAEKNFFLKLSGVVILGVVTLAASIITVLAFSPFILPFTATILPALVGTILVVAAIIMVWILVYIFAMMVVLVYYAIKHPAEVNTKSTGYTISKVKESGKREKKDN